MEVINLLNKNIINVLILILFLAGCTGSQKILDDERVENSLVPGLRVLYFYGMYRNIRQVPDGDRAILEKGIPGAPILIIDNQFGESEVFESGRNKGVGVQLKGYLHLEKKGFYQFQALSNDGVEVIIDGSSVLIDADVHSDRLSKIETLSVPEPGWHQLMVKYFQRKGTATIKLFWKIPGNDAFEVIPASAYGHLLDDSQ